MKKTILLLMVSLAVIRTSAQQDSAFFEIGINGFQLISDLGNAAPKKGLNPYLITADYSFGKIGVRAGFGINNRSRTDLPAPINGNTKLMADSTQRFVRIGLAYHKNLTSKWSMKTGVDFFTSPSQSKITTTFPDVNNKLIENILESERSERGISPFFYIQYHFSPRVSIGTELLMNITTWNQTDKSFNSEFPLANTEKKSEGKSFVVQPPSALFLSVRF